MPFILKRSVCAGLALMLIGGGCNPGQPGEAPKEPIRRQQQAISWNTPPTTDSIQAYAAKCDAATGIHVPSFSCNQRVEVAGDPGWPGAPNFTFIDQGSSVDNLEGDMPIGITGSERTEPEGQVPPDTVQIITAGGNGIPAAGAGSDTDEFHFAYATHPGVGRAEVLLTDMTDTNGMAGLMIRSNISDPAAANAFVGISGDQLVFQHRLLDGQTTTTDASQAAPSFPLWLRLAWSITTDEGTGENFRVVVAQYAPSDDYGNWTLLGEPLLSPFVPEALPLTGATIGLAVSGSEATFDDFRTDQKCDYPNALYGLCDPGATFQVLERTADAIVVANCRKGGHYENELFSDIAVIQYNRKNGAICFYQSDNEETIGEDTEYMPSNGDSIPAPSLGLGDSNFAWLTPEETQEKGCAGCHDNGGLLRSPYLWQTGLLPDRGYDNDGTNPLRFVGTDYQNDKTWFVEPGTSCTSCHGLAVGNAYTFNGWSGTATHFSQVATAPDQETPFKNPPSEFSKIWMPYPGQSEFDPTWTPYWQNVADRYTECADLARDYAGFPETVPYINEKDCVYELFGEAYIPPLDYLYEARVGIDPGEGNAAGNFDELTLTSAEQTDITEAADDFYWVYKIHPGDGAAIVRVDSLGSSGSPHEWAKAGIMFRDGNTPDATNVLLAVTPGPTHGVTFQYRPAPGEEVVHEELTGVDLGAGPVWLKLERQNRTFVAYASTDERNSWQQVGQPITVQANFINNFLGLVVTSNHGAPPGQLAQAVFKWFDWSEGTGWTRPPNPHRLSDANIGSNSGARKEWITQETLYSQGGDIWNAADDFFYSFKSFGGDGHVETRSVSLTAKDGGPAQEFAKAGLMIRESGAANARHVMVSRLSGGDGNSDQVAFQHRSVAGQEPEEWKSGALSGVDAHTPISFRLRRQGDTFTAAYKPDGASSWTEIPEVATLSAFSDLPLFGLALSSHESSAEAKAVFDSQELRVVSAGQEAIAPDIEPPGFQWFSYDQWENNHMSCLGIAEDFDQDVDEADGTCLEAGSPANRVITATGGPIFGASDQFVLSAQNLPGPLSVQAKVTVMGDQATHPYAKAGLMIRDNATPGSPNVMLAVTKSQGVAFQYRAGQDGNTSFPGFVAGTAPIWLKLERTANNLFNGYTSTDGVTWSLVSSASVGNISETAMVGLAVSSRDESVPVSVEFTDLSISLGGGSGTPCASFCQNPNPFTFSGNYQSGNLGSGASCWETTKSVAGGNCGNFAGGRGLSINGVPLTCNYQNWSSLPAPVGGGYCVEVSAGDYPWAYFSVFE